MAEETAVPAGNQDALGSGGEDSGGSLESQLSDAMRAVADDSREEPVASDAGSEGAVAEGGQETPSGATEGVEGEGGDSDGGAPSSSQLAAWMRDNLGATYASKYKNDFELLRGLDNAVHLVGERSEDARIGKWLRENPREAAEYLRQQVGMPAGEPRQEGSEAGAADQPARWNPKWERLFDASGQPVEGADPREVDKARQWAESYRQWQIEFADNPEQKIAPIVEQKAREILQQELGSFKYQMDDQSKAENFLRENKDWMFSGGEVGGQLSESGQLFHQGLLEGSSMGLADHDSLVRYATNYALAGMNVQNDGRQGTAPDPPTNRQAAKRTPSVAVPSPDDVPDMKDGETLEQAMASVFKAYGMPSE